MRPITLIIIISFLLGITFLSIYLWKIPVTGTQIIIASTSLLSLIVIIVIVKIVVMLSPKPTSRAMTRAEEFSKKEWERMTGETLTIREGTGKERRFGKEIVYGFLFHRKTGDKREKPLILMVGNSPMRLVDWEDEPSPDMLDNIFLSYHPVLQGTPAGLTSEMEPLYLRYRYKIPEKKKEKKPKEKEEWDKFRGKEEEED